MMKCNILLEINSQYLGIDVTKDILTRQQFNFLPRHKETKNIMNMWLQRDLSIFGRVLLTELRYFKASLPCSINVCPRLNIYANQ